MEEMIEDMEDIEKKLARCYSEVYQEVKENSGLSNSQKPRRRSKIIIGKKR
jgi:hypothetical protein